MKSLVDWLATVENRAFCVYSHAAERFRGDVALNHFFMDLASDEFCHTQYLHEASESLKDEDSVDIPVAVDEQRKAQLESPFDEVEKAFSAEALTSEQVIDCIAKTEFSEWNDIYLFVMNSLQKRGPSFMRMAAEVERHRRYIDHTIGKMPGGPERMEKFKSFPHVWKERILIVDDSPTISNLLTALCRDMGSITVVQDGAEALKRVGESYYDAIISDVNMPVMNGLDFYKKAAAADPLIRDRFLFFTAETSTRELDFFAAQSVKYLEKPAGISKLKKIVSDIISLPPGCPGLPSMPSARAPR